MIYIVRWHDDESPLMQCKRYERRDAALRFAEKLDVGCIIETYTDYGERVTGFNILKRGDSDERQKEVQGAL